MGLVERVKIFLKGIMMGLADTVPGVSGGTIAFITGIYERLIEGINSVDLKIPIHVLKGDFNGAWNSFLEIDFELFIPLGTGILFAFAVGSGIIVEALEFFPGTTFGFFFGLILASALKIAGEISERSSKSVSVVVLGAVLGYLFTGLESLTAVHNELMLFFSGFLAVFALILPGISGSFILLILGQYEYVLSAVHSFPDYILEITVFVFGGVVSLFGFSSFLSYLFRNYEDITLSFLTGLMVGSLRMPYGEIRTALLGGTSYLYVLTAFGVGLSIVFLGGLFDGS